MKPQIVQLYNNESAVLLRVNENASSSQLATPYISHHLPKLFAATESALGNFHYVFAAYVLPVVVVFGLVQNGWAAFVLARLTNGVGKTARVYYMALSLADMGNLLSLLVLFWLSLGLQFSTGGAFYLKVPYTLDILFYIFSFCVVPYTRPPAARPPSAQALTTRSWACKLSRSLYIMFPHILNWVYLLMCFERLVAVVWPLWAKVIFGVQRNLLYIFIIV